SAYCEPSPEEALEHRLPPRRGCRHVHGSVPTRFRLLVRIEDCQGITGTLCCSKALERATQPLFKEPIGLPAIGSEPKWGCFQLLGLWCEQGAEQIGEHILEGSPQPHIEVIGEVRISNVVVVGRVCRYHGIAPDGGLSRVQLVHRGATT